MAQEAERVWTDDDHAMRDLAARMTRILIEKNSRMVKWPLGACIARAVELMVVMPLLEDDVPAEIRRRGGYDAEHLPS